MTWKEEDIGMTVELQYPQGTKFQTERSEEHTSELQSQD